MHNTVSALGNDKPCWSTAQFKCHRHVEVDVNITKFIESVGAGNVKSLVENYLKDTLERLGRMSKHLTLEIYSRAKGCVGVMK